MLKSKEQMVLLWNSRVIQHGWYKLSVLEIKIWIYWSESNSQIYFYIYLNKNWKFYWSWARGPLFMRTEYKLQYKIVQMVERFIWSYRSLQVYQRSNTQVGHRVLSDFTLKIVRQMSDQIVGPNCPTNVRPNPPRSEWESPLSDS